MNKEVFSQKQRIFRCIIRVKKAYGWGLQIKIGIQSSYYDAKEIFETKTEVIEGARKKKLNRLKREQSQFRRNERSHQF